LPIAPKTIPPARIALILAAAVLLSVGLVASTSAEAKTKEGPKGGAFYKPPKNVPKGHGKVIWQRDATKLAPIQGAKVNKTILYTSKSPQGKPVSVSGSVAIPKGKAPKHGWPIISYAHGTTGAADSCAPTRVRPNSPVAPYVAYVDPQLQDWIAAGYAVVQTDYQGLGTPGPHPYLIGKAEGRSVVDMVSAARDLKPKLDKKFLIAGHSQGGQSALFAANLADSWAPKLKLRGTVSYAPASHIYEQALLLPALTSPSGLSALAALIFEGASTTPKNIEVGDILTAEAQALYPQVDQTCLAQLSEPDSFGGIAPSDLIQNGADTGPLYDVLKKMNPALQIKPPILLAQGTADTTVFPSFTDQLDSELTGDHGDDVDYQVYPGITHGGIVAAAEDQVMEFFQKRLPSGR
jgi:pimeloyl-ACP methyl ester carboxylesterase